MASSTGSLDTSATANSFTNFTFSTHPFMTTSFSDLLASPTDNNHKSQGALSERNASGVPKFKSTPPPSLPLSPPPISPSSYFAIPPGLSPAELLDSPVLLNASNVSFITPPLLSYFVVWVWLLRKVWTKKLKCFLWFFIYNFVGIRHH